MSYCDVCGNFDESYRQEMEYPKDSDHCIQDYQPDCYYYWDSPLEEDYDWRDNFPHVDCMCEICFDIANEEGKLVWVWQLAKCLLGIDLVGIVPYYIINNNKASGTN